MQFAGSAIIEKPYAISALSVIGASGVLLATRNGPGLSSDSTNYLSSGLNLAGGNGLRTLSGEILIDYAPGFSLFIAAVARSGGDVFLAVRVLNAVTFIAVILLSFILLKRHVQSASLTILGTASVALSPALLTIEDRAMSDPAFLMLALAFISVVDNWVNEHPGRVRPLLAAVSLVWAAFLVRYAGLILIPIGAVVCVLGFWRPAPGRAIVRAVWLIVGGLAVPVVWMIRTYAISGTLMGPRTAIAPTGVFSNLLRFFATLTEWVFPPAKIAPLPLASILGMVLVVAVGAALRRNSDRRENANPASAGNTLMPLLVFFFGYALSLILISSVIKLDTLNSRLLAPIYVPGVILAFAGADRVLRARVRPAITRLVTLAVVCYLAAQSIFFVVLAWRHGDGVGYRSAQWRQSGLVRSLSQLPDPAVIYSNEPGGVWAGSGREPSILLPYKTGDDARMTELLRTPSCRPTFMARFFDDPRGDQLVGPAELGTRLGLEVMSEADDGVLYRLIPPRGDAGCDSP